MKKGFFTLAFLMSSYSLAFIPNLGADKKIIQKINNSSQTSVKKTMATCSQFSGQWEGTCEIAGKKETKQLSIVQPDCMTLKYSQPGEESIDLSMGPSNMISENQMKSYYSMNKALSASWSSDGSVLQIVVSAMISSPLISTPRNVRISAQLLLDGTDLMMLSRADGADDGNGEVVCRYSKK